MNTTSKTGRNILLCAVLGALSAGACAEEPSEGELGPAVEQGDQAPETAAQQASGEQIRIASVSANGSGCPRGSYETLLSPDGLALTVSFSKYFLEATPSKPSVQTLACNVSLQLEMPRGYTVGVTKVSYMGYATLERGVVAEQIANYAWTGLGALASNQGTSKLTGPYDGTYQYTDNLETRGVGIYWAPCDVRSNLQIRSRLVLTNNSAGNGWINTSNLEVQQSTKLVIDFVRKSC